MITSSLERLRDELARVAVNQARRNSTHTACPCCGARMTTEKSQDGVFLYCGHCLFTTSSRRCGNLES